MVNRTLTGHHICNCNINTKSYTLLIKLIVQGVDIAFADIDTISIFVTIFVLQYRRYQYQYLYPFVRRSVAYSYIRLLPTQ